MMQKRNLLALILVATLLLANSVNVFAAPKKSANTPPAPTLSYSPSAPTNGNVTVTVYYQKSAVVKQYKLGENGIWETYSAPVVITENTYFYARYQNSSGNWSALASVSISNIDKVPPQNPIFTVSESAPTNLNVTVTIGFSSDSTVKQYRIGLNGTWTSYIAPIVLSSNTIVYAKSSDSVGNWTSIASCTVSNIDKTPPLSPVLSADVVEPTDGSVNVTIDYPADASVKKYKIGASGTWTDYNYPVTVSSNGIVYAIASDDAGNWTPETSYNVTNINNVAPIAPTFKASTTEMTNQDILLTINYSTASVEKQYKIGNSGLWIDYVIPITLSSNDTVYARASDSTGNWTPEASYVVTNIDKIPPANPTFNALTTSPTTQPVTLTINYSEDSVLKQYKIGTTGAWTNYSIPIVISSNSIIYAKSSDAVGNWSLEANYAVTNIVLSKMVLGYTVKYTSADMTSYNSMLANTSALNEIATATYSIDGYGNLLGTAPTDQINYANNNDIRPKLMVSNNFDANIAKQLLESPANRQNLKNNILNSLKTYNYKGVDIDIENIPAADRSYFTTFMSEIYSALKPLGYGVSVAVQAKTYDSPNAAWNYAYDYKSLAMYADYLMIMAYDEHYPGGTPGAVASIGWVTSVVDYALTVVPKDKIVLGLAAYGYDWSNGTTKSYSINSCYTLAANNGATVYLDSTTKSKYFTYTVSGVSHTVWFEDADTIAYKLDLVNSRDLKGIGIWRLGLENVYYWNTIKSKFNK